MDQRLAGERVEQRPLGRAFHEQSSSLAVGVTIFTPRTEINGVPPRPKRADASDLGLTDETKHVSNPAWSRQIAF